MRKVPEPQNRDVWLSSHGNEEAGAVEKELKRKEARNECLESSASKAKFATKDGSGQILRLVSHRYFSPKHLVVPK